MPAIPYFARRVPVAVVFGSFVLVLLPLLALRLIPNFLVATSYLAFFEATVLGTGHFFITLALYLQSGHLDHFARGARNRVLFFGVPVLILLGVAWLNVLQPARTGAFLVFFSALRFADFLHVGRQSFGMLQLFERARGARLPAAQKVAENVFFIAAAALQWLTFAAGGRFPLDSVWVCAASAAVWLFGLVIAAGQLASSLQHPREARSWTALGYFAMQAFAAGLAVWRTELYAIALTVHYTEYHVIMVPRCFRTQLDPVRRSDRWFAALRRRPLIFYGVLGVVVLAFELRERLDVAGAGVPLRLLVHLFDGIFLLHYFVEAFLWKFRDPELARLLAPLYLSPDGGEAPADAPRPSAPRAAVSERVFAGVAALGVLALSLPALGLVDAIHSRQHRRWAIDFAREGEFAAAKRHLSEALQHAPNDQELKQALQRVEARLSANSAP